MRHTAGLTALILAAGLFFSCTQGEYLGSGGGENLTIVDRTGTLNGKYIEVRGVKTTPTALTVGFSLGGSRKQVNGGKAAGAMYDLTTGDRYTGNDTFTDTEFTVKVYNRTSDPEPMSGGTKQIAVKFYSGVGLIDWK